MFIIVIYGDQFFGREKQTCNTADGHRRTLEATLRAFVSLQDYNVGLAIAEVELTAANIRDVDRRSFDINTPFKNFWYVWTRVCMCPFQCMYIYIYMYLSQFPAPFSHNKGLFILEYLCDASSKLREKCTVCV